MTDHAKRQYQLELNKHNGFSNRTAVAMVMCALFVPAIASVLFL